MPLRVEVELDPLCGKPVDLVGQNTGQRRVLTEVCRGLLQEAMRPTDELGEPLELAELVALVERLSESEIWQRARLRCWSRSHSRSHFPWTRPREKLWLHALHLSFANPDRQLETGGGSQHKPTRMKNARKLLAL